MVAQQTRHEEMVAHGGVSGTLDGASQARVAVRAMVARAMVGFTKLRWTSRPKVGAARR
jgi:hypothetical protein